jgi:hypothetical protein
MGENAFEIRFEKVDAAEANLLAQDLQADLIEAAPHIKVKIKKDRSDTQDFGATLVLVLGAPATLIIARAISQFLTRNSGAEISITPEGGVLAKRIDSKDAAKIAEAFAPKPNS